MNLHVHESPCFYDVIVVGAGPAGCAAAIAAGRQGAKTLLIESTGCMGGMATSALVSKWAPLTDKEKVIYHGLAYEIVDRYKKRAGIPEEKWSWINIYPEDLKIVYDEMAQEAGVDVLYFSQVCNVISDNGHIDSVIVANKAGLTAYRAHSYVDCTGDGDVAYMAGAACNTGDEEGNVQAASLCFVIAGCHMSKKPTDLKLNSNPKDGLWYRIIHEGKYPLLCKHFIPAILGESVVFANAGHIYGLDSTDPVAVSAAMAQGRKIAFQYLDALKEYLPDVFGDAYLVQTAPSMGVRESRRVTCDYVLTLADYAARRTFEDEVGRNSYWLDCHGVGKSGGKMTHVEHDAIDNYGPGDSHGIPLRCLIVKGFDNLMVAGRCISVERRVMAATRVMPNCLFTGEAAGVCCAMASKANTDVRSVEASMVIEAMK